MARTPKTPEEYIRLMAGQDVAGTADFSLVGNLISGYKKALESATNETVLYTNKLKQLNESSNTWQAPFMIKKSQYDTGIKGVRSYEARLNTKMDAQGNLVDTGVEFSAELEKTEMVMLEYARKKRGNLAKKLAQQEVSEFLGTFKRTNTDTVRIGYPVEKQRWLDVLNNQFGGDVSKAKTFFGKEMDAQMSASIYKSKDLSARDRAVEKEKEAKAEAKRKEQEEQEEKKKEKEDEAYKRKLITSFTKTLAVLGIIANICRRILTATLARAHEVKQEALTANALDLSTAQYRQFKFAETALGLPTGSFTGAMGTIQSKFGDITNLDNKAIEQLARVMGGQVREMIELGIGKENPELLMEAILDAYFKRGQSGVNSVGMYVGKEKAERELATALENAGLKELATVLRNMYYTNDFGVHRGEVTNFESFINLTKAFTGGLNNFQLDSAKDLGTALDELNAMFKQFKDNTLTKFMLAIEAVIMLVYRLGIGLSADEKIKIKQEDRDKSRKQVEVLRNWVGKDKSILNGFYSESLPGGEKYKDLYSFLSALGSGTYKFDTSKEEDIKMLQWLRTPEGQRAINMYGEIEQLEANMGFAEKHAKDKSSSLTYDYRLSSPSAVASENAEVSKGNLARVGKLYRIAMGLDLETIGNDTESYSPIELFDYAVRTGYVSNLDLDARKESLKASFGKDYDAKLKRAKEKYKNYAYSEEELITLLYLQQKGNIKNGTLRELVKGVMQESEADVGNTPMIDRAVYDVLKSNAVRSMLSKYPKGTPYTATVEKGRDDKLSLKLTIDDSKGNTVPIGSYALDFNGQAPNTGYFNFVVNDLTR